MMQVWIAFGIALLWGAAPDIGNLSYKAAGLVPQHVRDGVWVFLLVILPRALPGALVGLALYYAMSVTFDVHIFGVTGAIRTIEKTLNHERAQ